MDNRDSYGQTAIVDGKICIAFQDQKILSCLLQLLLLCVSLPVLSNFSRHITWDSYIQICRYGSIIALAVVVLYAYATTRFVSPMMLIILSFVTFQFGIPILYTVDPSYSNWYISFINAQYLIAGAAYTVFCIQMFVLGASLCHHKPKKLEDSGSSFFSSPFLTDRSSVIQVATVLFALSGLIAFPRAVLFFRTSLTSGIAGARANYAAGGIVNIARGLFIPSGFLLLVYLPKDKRRVSVGIILLIYSLFSALSGDRTEGLTLLVCLAFYFFVMNRTRTRRPALLRGVILIVAGIGLLWLLAVIARVRTGHVANGMSLWTALTSAIDEMGFNSLTISFQMQVSPYHNYGLSYLASLTALIPKSLDFAGITQAVSPLIAVNIYYDVMGHSFSWATFGLGYSLIAESWVNFGFAGCIAIGVIGAVIDRLVSTDASSAFGQYMSLVFLWSFLTLPRRDTTWLLNAFEWDFLIILCCLWIWHSLSRHTKTTARIIRPNV